MRYSFAEIKAMEPDGDDLIIEGIASTGNVDRMGDIVDMQSIKDAIKRFKPKTLLYGHSMLAAIGQILHMEPTDSELLVRASVGHGFDVPIVTALGGVTLSVDSIRKQIEQGILNTFSIGYVPDDEQEEGKDAKGNDGRKLKILELLEISVVGIPANRECEFSVAKSYSAVEAAKMSWPHAAQYGVDISRIKADEWTSNRIELAEGGHEEPQGDEELLGGLRECLKRIRK